MRVILFDGPLHQEIIEPVVSSGADKNIVFVREITHKGIRTCCYQNIHQIDKQTKLPLYEFCWEKTE